MFPNRVKKIIIVNSPHFHSFRNLYQSSVQQRLRSWYFVFFQLPWIPEAFLRFNRFWALRRMLYAFKSHSEDDVNRYVEAFASPGALTGMINYYRALHAGYWPKVGCSHIQKPVEVIWGAKDPYLDSRLAHPPEHLVPNATVLLFPQLAHWPMWDDSEIFNGALLKSLA
ncbi:hypothetical protein KP509_11G062300 [Ceratopteris richardii]|uniref:AB hydrolase-1 domain-containing protein n=1 Tax=Ceratopteris richardii TaxID=49495 RepID=A0A8T2TW49_CERRI|nr:hypothetical protein KP509_11G062300 [Ceratopteris richardii]